MCPQADTGELGLQDKDLLRGPGKTKESFSSQHHLSWCPDGNVGRGRGGPRRPCGLPVWGSEKVQWEEELAFGSLWSFMEGRESLGFSVA